MEQTTKQLVEQSNKKDRRSGKGRVIALSRRVYRLQNTDVFYVESESSDNIYYFVSYNSDVLEWCSCPDNSIRGQKCKHQFSIEYAIRLGTLQDIEQLPTNVQRYPTVITKSYRDDDYDF